MHAPVISSMHAPRLCVSALSGGGGKTLLSLGLARALCGRGMTIKPFKKGPDYIDAAWLGLAAGHAATNLDPFFLSPENVQRLFFSSLEYVRAPAGGEVLALLEGNRGLFDGLDVEGSCSTAELARTLSCPVLLSLNCTKMTRTAAALVQGMLNFEPGLQFCGLVLNQTGSVRHETILRRILETYTDVPVLGALPRLSENPLPERHMGIASSGHTLSEDAQRRLDSMADHIRQHLDLDAVLAAARAAPDIPVPETMVMPAGETRPEAGPHVLQTMVHDAQNPADQGSALRPRIGYVRDAALWFYYEDNLQALEDAGAELICLSLVGHEDRTADAAIIWDNLDGLYLGGGFPEDCLPALSRSSRLAQLACLAAGGLPVYAECGGFMLLSRAIERDGNTWPMGGIFPVTTRFCSRPQGLGYVSGTVMAENPFFPTGLTLRGHEFHYSRCHWHGVPPQAAVHLERGQGMGPMDLTAGLMGDGLVRWRVWAAYTHIFAPAVPCWAPNFVAAARRFHQERQQ